MYVEGEDANGNVKILLATVTTVNFFRIITVTPSLNTNQLFCSDVSC